MGPRRIEEERIARLEPCRSSAHGEFERALDDVADLLAFMDHFALARRTRRKDLKKPLQMTVDFVRCQAFEQKARPTAGCVSRKHGALAVSLNEARIRFRW